MVKTLQRKFIFASMLAVTILLVTLVGAINILYGYSVYKRQSTMLEMLCVSDGKPEGPRGLPDADQGGAGPERDQAATARPDLSEDGNLTTDAGPTKERQGGQQENSRKRNGGNGLFQRRLSMDEALAIRYFAVWFDEAGEITSSDTSRIYAVSEEGAGEMAQEILSLGKSRGVFQGFRYMIADKETVPSISADRILVAMDISSDKGDMIRILGISALIAALCWAAMLVPVFVLAGRAIAPTAMSIERQKQFVTNAGHELKTPLAIIQANTDALELYTGASKWTRNIRVQTVRLNGLMQNLLTLARMDEDSLQLEKKPFELDLLAEEVWEHFAEPAESRKLSVEIVKEKDGIPKVLANRESISQLLSILYDNAVKYTPRGGRIEVRTFSDGSGVKFTQSNTFSGTGDRREMPEDPERLFERFYRTDSDRSRKKGGYGIGLSAARAIAGANNGSIHAGIADGEITFTVSLKAVR